MLLVIAMMMIAMQTRSSDESELMKPPLKSRETALFPGGLIYSWEEVTFQVEL